MKKGLGIIVLLVILTSCGNSNGADSNGNTEESSSTIESASTEKIEPERRSNMHGTSQTKTEQSSSLKSSESKEVTDDQKKLLIVYTQQDLDDYGYDYKYQGYDSWNVVTQDVTELKRYIITTEDSTLGRIKSIYEWTGDQGDGATLLYLLVSGEELINKL